MQSHGTFLKRLQNAVRGRLSHFDWLTMMFWSVIAGLMGATATELFRLALYWSDQVVFGRGGSLVALAQSLDPWVRVLVPPLGGLVAGMLLVWAQRYSTEQGHPDYMDAATLGDGRIPVGQSVFRSASSLVSIASGGSIGREGSMVQLAAMCASLLGRRLRFPVDRLRLLVACGAAAGITAAYSAPLAGAFFVAEIVLGSIELESLGPIMVAAVVANTAMRAFPGYQPPYVMPLFPAVQGLEVVLFGFLGVLAGLGAAMFLRGLTLSRQWFSALPLALPLRMGLGGLVVGGISFALPQVWGNGYSVVNGLLHSSDVWTVLLVLLIAKVIATFATVGSGAVGGVFTPALFFGCILGDVYGQSVQAIWPHFASASFAYAIVGMGAFLAASTQAPLMAMLMLFEMTLSYQVMLPLMVACVVAYFVARSVNAGSMYDITLRRMAQRTERQRLRMQQVRDLIKPAETVVSRDAGLDVIGRQFAMFPVKYLYVVDAQGHYLGVVPLKTLSAAVGGHDPSKRDAAGLLTREIEPLTCDMSLEEALKRFLAHQGERLPVIKSLEEPLLLGVVHKSVLLATYVRLSR